MGELFGVDVRGSELEERFSGAPAFGGVDGFKEAGSWVEEGGFEIGNVGAGFDPGLTGGGLIAVPVFEFGDLEIKVLEARKPRFAFDHFGELADREAVLDGDWILPDEGCVGRFEDVA